LIDLFTLALTHGLIALALWRMLFRDDLDLDPGAASGARKRWRKPARGSAEEDERGA
jgi:hypothetical protein